MKRSGRILVVSIIFFLIGCGGAPAEEQGREKATPSPQEVNERCRDILSRFHAPELGKDEKLRRKLGKASFHLETISTANEASFWGKDGAAVIDLDRGFVGVFMNFRESPHGLGLPQGVDVNELAKEIRKRGGISLDQAVEAGRRFVIERAGEQALEGLILADKRLSPTPDRVLYTVRWAPPQADPKVQLGRREIYLEINPITGGIWSYVRVEEPVSLPPRMSLEECRRIALKFLEDDGQEGIELLYFWYQEVKMTDGSVRPMWYVTWGSENAREDIPIPAFIYVELAKVEIDALTGKVRFQPFTLKESWPWPEETETPTPTVKHGSETPSQ